MFSHGRWMILVTMIIIINLAKLRIQPTDHIFQTLYTCNYWSYLAWLPFELSNTKSRTNKSLFVKEDMSPPYTALSQKACVAIYIEGHCDLDFHLIDPKINREHLRSMTNVRMKSEKARPNQTVVIDQTRKYDRLSDGQTGAKQYTRGRHNNGMSVTRKLFGNIVTIRKIAHKFTSSLFL